MYVAVPKELLQPAESVDADNLTIMSMFVGARAATGTVWLLAINFSVESW